MATLHLLTTNDSSSGRLGENEYVQLAVRSLEALCDLAAALEDSRGVPKVDFVADVLKEVYALWERLSWSDRILNRHECAILDAIMRLAETRGDAPLNTKTEALALRAIPEFLRVASLTQGHGPRVAGRMINHLESFGYGVLAADREIDEVELASLKEYLGWLRSEVEAVRMAAQ